jgi:hypothetical protein
VRQIGKLATAESWSALKGKGDAIYDDAPVAGSLVAEAIQIAHGFQWDS